MRALGLMLAASAAISFASAAQATVTLTSTPGTSPYTGPVPTYDFESAAPVTGGLVTTGSVGGVRAQPFGSTGNYWTVGPSDGTPGTLDLSSFTDIFNLSFLWGSVDTYNTLEVLNGLSVMATFTGIDASAFANGNQTDPFTNPLVTLLFTGGDESLVTGLRLSSSQNAFETDNYAVNAAVPEPATWATMLFGFGAIGFAMRRRRKPALLAQAA